MDLLGIHVSLTRLLFSSPWRDLHRIIALRMVKTLIISHTVFLVAGFAIGKFINYDELATYRELHEGRWTRIRRQVGGAVIGAVTLGTLILVIRGSSSRVGTR